jgi:carbon monoxide dehydrogenase subunit G
MTVVAGERRFPAPPERIFALLTDPSVIAAAVPAVRSHRMLDADRWEARVKPPLPLAPSFRIRFEVTGRRPPEHAGLVAHGGGAHVTSTFDLRADGEGATLMQWQAEVHLGGILDRFAGPGLDAIARHQAERTLDAVDRALAR